MTACRARDIGEARGGGRRGPGPPIEMLPLPMIKGSDYFTENFQVKENKTKMRNIHPHLFHLLF